MQADVGSVLCFWLCAPCRYAFCPNLTIIDTPGFILKAKAGEVENTPDEIMSMVKAQASPPHRCVGSVRHHPRFQQLSVQMTPAFGGL